MCLASGRYRDYLSVVETTAARAMSASDAGKEEKEKKKQVGITDYTGRICGRFIICSGPKSWFERDAFVKAWRRVPHRLQSRKER